MGAPEVLDAAISERRVFLPKHGDTQRIVLELEDEGEGVHATASPNVGFARSQGSGVSKI
jgi:hypothetical protein